MDGWMKWNDNQNNELKLILSGYVAVGLVGMTNATEWYLLLFRLSTFRNCLRCSFILFSLFFSKNFSISVEKKLTILDKLVIHGIVKMITNLCLRCSTVRPSERFPLFASANFFWFLARAKSLWLPPITIMEKALDFILFIFKEIITRTIDRIRYYFY